MPADADLLLRVRFAWWVRPWAVAVHAVAGGLAFLRLRRASSAVLGAGSLLVLRFGIAQVGGRPPGSGIPGVRGKRRSTRLEPPEPPRSGLDRAPVAVLVFVAVVALAVALAGVLW